MLIPINNNTNPLPPPLTHNYEIPSNPLNVRIEKFESTKSPMDYKYKYRESISVHFHKMKTYFERLNDLGVGIMKE